MEQKQFKLINNIIAFIVLIVASITYISTIEPTASFWDCGEFIASSYKLEVGHAPGNPVFQLIARFFTIFTSAENAAVAINIMSALCSAFTIFFLYLTIVHLGRRLLENNNKSYLDCSNSIIIFGSAILGSLAYCWSDTFWFSAVEGEVYAMSSLFTAVVFWAMLRWEEEADEPYANRWIILIAFLMGLSIGVHLLNLLVIPPLAFIYYYKKSSDFSFKKGLSVFIISCIVLGFILWGIIPILPKIAAYFDLLFVNIFKLPFNSGVVFFMLLLLISCFAALYILYKKKKAFLFTAILSFTMIVIGYSSFAVIIIRSSANTPTNEYQPDNPFTLVRYLNREQYGSRPLIYGESYASIPKEYVYPNYYTPLDGQYFKTPSQVDIKFPSEGKMFFPRMWSRYPDHIDFYKLYTQERGKTISNGRYKMPLFKDNLAFFFDYQLNWMYFRYFMWNFAGRQNDIHATSADPTKGNWESGIGFIDRARLGDQSEGPDYIVNNKAKNHYYMLPLLLGLIGLFYQLQKDKRNWWITMLLFFLTGIAIVLYLNQTPNQVRERDYAYAGSFYVFSIWIGLAAIAIQQYISKYIPKKESIQSISAATISILLLSVPVLMACENWDDHDRSGRYTSRDLAYNYLSTLDENAILVTHGDNDTFPIWYIQEVEGVRLDTRIVNTSLLAMDWYIDQIQCQQYDAAPIEVTIPRKDYLFGTNDFTYVINRFDSPILLKDAISFFKSSDPRAKIEGHRYLPSNKLAIPVNKENVIKYGIVAQKDYDKIVDTVILEIPEKTEDINKTELILLDILSTYNWDRPIYFVSQGGDLNIGLKSYLQFEGLSYKFVPIKSTTKIGEIGQIDEDSMYEKIMNTFKWDSFYDTTIHIDYQNLLTLNGTMNLRSIFVETALKLSNSGKKEKAVEILDKMQEVVPDKNFPLNSSILYSLNEYMVIQAVELYLRSGAKEKGIDLANRFAKETIESIKYFIQPYRGGFLSKKDFENNYALYDYVVDILNNGGANEAANEIKDKMSELISSLQ